MPYTGSVSGWRGLRFNRDKPQAPLINGALILADNDLAAFGFVDHPDITGTCGQDVLVSENDGIATKRKIQAEVIVNGAAFYSILFHL